LTLFHSSTLPFFLRQSSLCDEVPSLALRSDWLTSIPFVASRQQPFKTSSLLSPFVRSLLSTILDRETTDNRHFYAVSLSSIRKI
jgi:hypothetical protein